MMMIPTNIKIPDDLILACTDMHRLTLLDLDLMGSEMRLG